MLKKVPKVQHLKPMIDREVKRLEGKTHYIIGSKAIIEEIIAVDFSELIKISTHRLNPIISKYG